MLPLLLIAGAGMMLFLWIVAELSFAEGLPILCLLWIAGLMTAAVHQHQGDRAWANINILGSTIAFPIATLTMLSPTPTVLFALGLSSALQAGLLSRVPNGSPELPKITAGLALLWFTVASVAATTSLGLILLLGAISLSACASSRRLSAPSHLMFALVVAVAQSLVLAIFHPFWSESSGGHLYSGLLFLFGLQLLATALMTDRWRLGLIAGGLVAIFGSLSTELILYWQEISSLVRVLSIAAAGALLLIWSLGSQRRLGARSNAIWIFWSKVSGVNGFAKKTPSSIPSPTSAPSAYPEVNTTRISG
jgi:hypothetical protein